MADSQKTLLLVNVLYSFVVAAMAVVVPLYLLDKQIDVVEIGLIMSVMPLAFMIFRLLFASIADGIGTRMVGIIYALANLVSIAAFGLASSPIGFAFGKVAESVRASGFWAIIRTDTISLNGKSGGAGRALAYFGSLRELADGAGRLAVGFMLAYLSFNGSFIAMFALSVALLLFAMSFRNGKNSSFSADRKIIERIARPRPGRFWYDSAVLTFLPLCMNLLIGFLLPLYCISALGFSYEETGFMLAIISVTAGIMMLASLRMRLSGRWMFMLTLLMLPALLLFPFAGKNVLPLVVLIALGYGCGTVLCEWLLADLAAKSSDISTDIGLIYVPLRVGEFVSFIVGGLVISAFGFAPLFYGCAILVGLFVVFAKGYAK